MEALQRLKDKYCELGVEYKSEIKDGKETLVIDGYSEPLSSPELCNFCNELGDSLIWSGSLTPLPDGKCEAIMKVTSKPN